MPESPEVATITPFPLAMVVCDFIYRDPYTGKYTLIGTFSTISGTDFPLQHPYLFVYASLTGGRGKIPVKLEVIDADEQHSPIASLDGEIDSKNDPRAIHELAFGLGGLQFPEAGEYRIVLHANQEFMIERRLLVFNPQQEAQQ